MSEHTGEHELTERELDVLWLIAPANPNKEIAAQGELAQDTAKRHVTNILSNWRPMTAQAVTIALNRGIIHL